MRTSLSGQTDVRAGATLGLPNDLNERQTRMGDLSAFTAPGFRSRLTEVLSETATAKALPNPCYTDPDFLAFERVRLFEAGWACIGFGKDVANPGDVVPRNLMGLPLILVRDTKNEIRVFHNVCSHRGAELVTEPCHVGAVLRCPYHSRAYDLEGKLKATPFIGGPNINRCDGFDKSAHGLRPVRTAVWFDMVFVNVSGQAPEFSTYIAPLAERWSMFDQSLIRHSGADSSSTFDVNCNWKLAVENYCEAYHLPWVHPALNTYSKLEDHYNINEWDSFAGQGSRVYRPTLTETGEELPNFPGPDPIPRRRRICGPVPERAARGPPGPFHGGPPGARRRQPDNGASRALLCGGRGAGGWLRPDPLGQSPRLETGLRRRCRRGRAHAARPRLTGLRRRRVLAGDGRADPLLPQMGRAAFDVTRRRREF